MNWVNQLRGFIESRSTIEGLKVMIIVWSIAIILLALLIDNPYVLTGILLYEILP